MRCGYAANGSVHFPKLFGRHCEHHAAGYSPPSTAAVHHKYVTDFVRSGIGGSRRQHHIALEISRLHLLWLLNGPSQRIAVGRGLMVYIVILGQWEH
jgi:hypothetical protein